MKFVGCFQRAHSIRILSLLFVGFMGVLLFTFAHTTKVFAHDPSDADDKKASDVDVTSEAEVKAFLSHVVEHYESLSESALKKISEDSSTSRQFAAVARELRTNLVYKDLGSGMYVILIDSGGTVLNHSAYPDLFGYKFDVDSEKEKESSAEALQILIKESTGGNTKCEDYEYGDKTRWACGTRVDYGPLEDALTAVVGLHHKNRDDNDKTKLDETNPFSKPDCPGFLELGTTAKKVSENPTEANLKAYVREAIESLNNAVAEGMSTLVGKQNTLDLSTPVKQLDFAEKIAIKLNSLAGCMSLGEFKHENIYLFVMTATPEGTVFVNGNNADLNGLTLELEDEELDGDDKKGDDKKIVTLFRNALIPQNRKEKKPKVGDSAIVEYRWSDPAKNGADLIKDWLEKKSVPGTTPKKSYIQVTDITSGIDEKIRKIPGLDQLLDDVTLKIVGSGIYPTPTTPATKDDDDGCAIAGTDHSSQNALVNLLLITSVLFSIVFLRRRA